MDTSPQTFARRHPSYMRPEVARELLARSRSLNAKRANRAVLVSMLRDVRSAGASK